MPHVHELKLATAQKLRAIEPSLSDDGSYDWQAILADAGPGDLCLVRARDDAPPMLSDSPTHRALCEACDRFALNVAWLYRETCTGRVYQAMSFVDAAGNAKANYRCSHPDAALLAAGMSPGGWLTVVPWSSARVGLLIGADIEHPEVARAIALSGAEALLWIDHRPGAQRHWRILIQARAIENALPVFALGETLSLALPNGGIRNAAGQPLTFAWAQASGPSSGSERRPPLYQGLVNATPIR